MAKRAPINEGPYRPLLDAGVISAALSNVTPAAKENPGKGTQATVIDLNRGEEIIRRDNRPPSRESLRTLTEERRETAWAVDAVEKLDQEKRMLLTKTESLALDRLVNSLAGRVNTQLKLSHVLRSLVTLLLHAEGEIDKRAGDKIGLSRPANGDFKGIQRFEREIAKIIADALRDAGPLREG